MGSALHDVSTRGPGPTRTTFIFTEHACSLSPLPPPAWRCSRPLCGPLFSSDLVKLLFCNELCLLIKEMS